MAKYYVGWDVGAWHCDKNKNSKDAIVIQEENSNEVFLFYGNVKNFFSVKSLDDFFKVIFPDCIAAGENEYNIAVDAVLGWPEKFIALITGKKEEINTKEIPVSKIENHFLLRECERELCGLGIQPLSSVQDMLGSQSTKVLFFLHKFDFCNQEGVWTKDNSKVYETYPAIIAKRLNDWPKVTQFYHQVSRNGVVVSQVYKPQGEHQDFKDALLALAAIKNGFQVPERPINKIEGWIWLPKIND